MRNYHVQNRAAEHKMLFHRNERDLKRPISNVGCDKKLRHRILCVDDEVVGTTIRGEILRETGYSVALFHNPLEVLRRDISTFNLAIVDFQMPEMNGRELVLRMRALGARFPILLLTGSLESIPYEDRILFARCINKGMSVQFLLDNVAECLAAD